MTQYLRFSLILDYLYPPFMASHVYILGTFVHYCTRQDPCLTYNRLPFT